MPKAPTSEIGHVSEFSSLPGWGQFVGDAGEHAREVRWPKSIETFTNMRTDAQIQALTKAISLPLRRMQWCIDPGDADERIAGQIAQDLGLPLKGETDQRVTGRRKDRFSHDGHLSKALVALWLGFYPFEIVGRIADDELWHLRKLAPRHPRTLVGGRIDVEPDGGLKSMTQTGMRLQSREMPVSRLVVYVWDNEDGANWTGQSMLRPLYRNWLMKDRTLRIGTLNIDRNGMGVPSAEAPEGAGDEEIEAINATASQIKAGERSSVTWPHGTKFKLAGVEGSLPDAAGWVRLQNEEMARAFLEMFMQLGQTETGSRALGGEFVDFFDHALEAVADWYVEITTAHMIEKWVDWNYGPDEPAPELAYIRHDTGVSELATAVDSGLIQVDAEIEAAVRRHLRLPQADGPQPEPFNPPEPEPAAAASRGHRPQVGARTERNEVEIRAQTDFESIEGRLETKIEALVASLRELQGPQIDELVAQVEAAGADPAALAEIRVPPAAEDALADAMGEMVDAGVDDALDEARSQNVSDPVEPDRDEVRERIRPVAQAKSIVLANALSEAASRHAVARASDALPAERIASEVRDHLEGLSDAFLSDQANQALVGGQNTGRKATFVANDPTSYHASELLDQNTCSACANVDGKVYETMADAEADYPLAGYIDCYGGPRCRGTLVAIYDESEPSV